MGAPKAPSSHPAAYPAFASRERAKSSTSSTRTEPTVKAGSVATNTPTGVSSNRASTKVCSSCEPIAKPSQDAASLLERGDGVLKCWCCPQAGHNSAHDISGSTHTRLAAKSSFKASELLNSGDR